MPKPGKRVKPAADDALAAFDAAVRAAKRTLKATTATRDQTRAAHAAAVLARLSDAAATLTATMRDRRAAIAAADRSKRAREAQRVWTAVHGRKHLGHIKAVAKWLDESTRDTGCFPSVNAAVTALVAAAEKGEAEGVPALGPTQMRALMFDAPAHIVVAAIKPDKPMRDAIAAADKADKAMRDAIADVQAWRASTDALHAGVASMEALLKQLPVFDLPDTLLRSARAAADRLRSESASMEALLKQLAELSFRSAREPKT